MTCLRFPAPEEIENSLAKWATCPLSYPHTGGVDHPPARGFLIDRHEVCLGAGEAVFRNAAAALDAWTMFPTWTRVLRTRSTGQLTGEVAAMTVCIVGLWWINPCRILSRCDSPRTHGFVYGTLPEHAECGEEQFLIEWRADDSVWYVLRAFSRPRHPLAWIGFPCARWWQLRFVRDSQERLKAAVA
jgi:uncharacterized protein (UPF0548 family)